VIAADAVSKVDAAVDGDCVTLENMRDRLADGRRAQVENVADPKGCEAIITTFAQSDVQDEVRSSDPPEIPGSQRTR